MSHDFAFFIVALPLRVHARFPFTMRPYGKDLALSYDENCFFRPW
jgi:hypothetical protein